MSTDLENQYSQQIAQDQVDKGEHRAFIGGMWDEIGQLQFDYICRKGLQPHDRFIDVGCGSLRGGVHFVKYLDPFHYYGFDINASLIDAGLTHEITPLGLLEKTRPENFRAADNFGFPDNWRGMNSAIALSLFTHLTLNSIILCLERLRPVMADGARFYATIFHVSGDEQTAPKEHVPGIVTFLYQDPYHYTREDMDFAARKTGWRVVDVETFNHPRHQSMVVFEKI